MTTSQLTKFGLIIKRYIAGIKTLKFYSIENQTQPNNLLPFSKC